MATYKIAPYRNFLTPVLHRRFTGAALVILVICYLEAIAIGDKSSLLWSWFPIGSAGIRTLLLFISALSVFVLRVAQFRLGKRITSSDFATFKLYLFRLDTIQIYAWYIFSAWWFSEVYIWSAPDSADLGWIAVGKSWERRKLNERTVYLRSVYFTFAFVQTILHIYYDYDSIPLSLKAPTEPRSAIEEPTGAVAYVKNTLFKEWEPLKNLFWYDEANVGASIFRNVLLRTLFMSLACPFLYAIFIRRTAWKWSSSFVAFVWDVPPAQLSFIPPHYPSLIYRSLTSGSLLIFLFEASNALFTAYVANDPLKRGQPISAESKDPNGTLLTGLKAKKEIPQTFALWELSYISAHPSPRRTTIFSDIDRPSGPVWTQAFAACLSNVRGVESRISLFLNPASATQESVKLQAPAVIETLPRISTPIRQDNILSRPSAPHTSTEKIEANIGSIAKSFGQSPNPGTLKLPSGASAQGRNIAQNLLPSTPSRKLLTQGPDASGQNSSGGVLAVLKDWNLAFLRSPFGIPLRKTFARQARSVVLSSPTSSLHPLLSSIRVLSSLAVASLKEDPYGKVAKDIPLLIRSLVSTTRVVEDFMTKKLTVHWSDVAFKEGESGSGRHVPEIDLLIKELKKALGSVTEAFEPFAEQLNINKVDIAVAKQLVSTGDKVENGAKKPDMIEVH